MNEKQPWGKDYPFKTKQDFMQWLRSQSRRIWSRSPIKLEYRKRLRYKAPIGLKGKEVWVVDCEICGKQTRQSETDHIRFCGSFTTWDEYTQWLERLLLVTYNDIRELCKECHEIVTLSQRLNCSFDEARIRKKVIVFEKMILSAQKSLLKQIGKESGKTKKENVAIYEEHVREQNAN